MIYTLKDLRNAVAHNNTIFDTRFKTAGINKRIGKYISNETGISNITFDTIVDYVILIAFLMKLLDCPKTEILSFIRAFESESESLRKAVDIQIYTSVIYTDTRSKLQNLKNWLRAMKILSEDCQEALSWQLQVPVQLALLFLEVIFRRRYSGFLLFLQKHVYSVGDHALVLVDTQ